MSDIYRYISSNYHTFFMKSRGMYSVDYETLIQDLYNIIADLFRTGKLVVNNIPKLIFINTAERKSKYIVTNDGHYILLDLRQILECTWGSRVAIGIDGDIFSVVSAGSHRDEENYDVSMSLYLYSSDQNVLKARICNCYNLADLCFSKGYVDAAIKNLCSIMAMREDIHSNDLADLMFSTQFSYEAKIIGKFIYIHELTHFFLEQNKKNINGIGEFEKLIKLIHIKYESGDLSKEWRKYACQYSSDNYIANKEISNLFSALKIDDQCPGLFEQLRDNLLSWKDMNFDLRDWELFSEELICDIIALNTIIGNENQDYYIIYK